MRVVTITTVLGNWRMLPQVRATLLGVAVEAGLVERLLGKLPLARCAMSTVAAAAVHLALPDRVRIRLESLCALLLVAFEAHVGLRRRHQNGIAGGVARMAIGARYVIHIVVVAVPAEACIGCMTIQAQAILHVDRRTGTGTEIRAWCRSLLAATNASRVIT